MILGWLTIYGTKVKVMKQAIDEALGWNGYYDTRIKTIVVAENLKTDELTSVLVHEFIHSVIDRLGWRQFLTKELEELCCEQISVAIAENFDVKLKVRGGNKMAKKTKPKPAKPASKPVKKGY